MTLVYLICEFESIFSFPAKFIRDHECKNIVSRSKKRDFIEISFTIDRDRSSIEGNITDALYDAFYMCTRNTKGTSVHRFGQCKGGAEDIIMCREYSISDHDTGDEGKKCDANNF